MAVKPKPKADALAEPPDVERHDEVYFRHPSGPMTGKVLARGAHGVTVAAAGGQHKVKWEHLLGHKQRAQITAKVIDEGEDGLIVEDERGQRRYIHDPVGSEPRSLAPIAKSHMPMVLLFAERELLAKAIKNRPGLSLQDVTDRGGKRTKRWKKTTPDSPGGQTAPAQRPESGERRPPGTKVEFSLGSLKGSGEVIGKPGRDGAHIRDESGHDHQVPWSAMRPAGGDGSGSKDAGDGGAGFYSDEETKGLPRKADQPHGNWNDLAKHGAEALEQFKDTLLGVAKELGLETKAVPRELDADAVASDKGYLFIGNLKSAERAAEKVEADYDGDWSKLSDVVRATISVATMSELHKAVAAVKAAGLSLAQAPKDKFAQPTAEGYRDLNTVVKLPNGMLAELQFHLKSMTAAKSEMHGQYAITRTLQAKHGSEAPNEDWDPDDHQAFEGAIGKQRENYEKAWKNASG